MQHISTRTATGLRTPLGLGARRHCGIDATHPVVTATCHDTAGSFADRFSRLRPGTNGRAIPAGPTVIDGLHAASPEVLTWMARLLCDHPDEPLVLAGATGIPPPLSAQVGIEEDVGPVSGDAFASLHRGQPRDVVNSGYTYSGGWPEACVFVEGTWHPSPELRRFIDGLGCWDRDLSRLFHLLAVAPGGLPPEILAEALGMALAPAFELVRRAEHVGLGRWEGSLARVAVPALCDRSLTSQTDRRGAAAALAGSPHARRHGFAALPAVYAGLTLDDDLRRDALATLHLTESPPDMVTWERTASIFAGHHDPVLAKAGGSSLARLALTRGKTQDDVLSEVDVDLDWWRRILDLKALDATALTTSTAPSFEILVPGGIEPGPNADLSMRGVARAVRGDHEGAMHVLTTMSPEAPGARILKWLILSLRGDFAGMRAVEKEEEDLAAGPLGSLFPVVRLVIEGRYVTAADSLDQVVSHGWNETSPLHGILRLIVATGVDVALTRRLLPATQASPPGRVGSLATRAVRARAEAVTGNITAAAQRYAEIWRESSRLGHYGALSLYAIDALDILDATDVLEPVLATDPVGPIAPYVELARALDAVADPASAEAVVQGELVGPYRQARALHMVGRHRVEAGDIEGAARNLLHAQAMLDDLGAPVDAGRVRVTLRRIDPSLDRAPALNHPDSTGIPQREREVLDLIGQGLTNKEIAAELHISPATVKRHVASLLCRFDVRNRRQLASLRRDPGA